VAKGAAFFGERPFKPCERKNREKTVKYEKTGDLLEK
jgi:hypothetical protein